MKEVTVRKKSLVLDKKMSNATKIKSWQQSYGESDLAITVISKYQFQPDTE